MKNHALFARRRLTQGLALAVVTLGLPLASHAQAQPYPTRPIRMIVPAAPGGGTDVMARTLAKLISEQNNVPVIVDNRAGASGSIGVQATINSPADGYTIMMTLADATIIYPLTRKVQPYRADKDLTPIAQVAWTNVLISVSATSPYKSVKELIEASKTKRMAYSSNGYGTNTHLWMELFKVKTGAQLLHVPYKGATPALLAMVAGETDIAISSPASAKALLDAGRLRPLAIGSAQRFALFPNVATLAESGYPELVFGAWFGIFGPANMNPEIADKLHAMIIAAMKTPEYIKHAETFVFDVQPTKRAQFIKLIADDEAVWRQAIEAAQIKPED